MGAVPAGQRLPGVPGAVSSRLRRPSSLAARTSGFTTAYLVAALVGRATIVDGEALSLVWPAAGVAVLWFLTLGTRTERLVGATALSGATVVVNVLTGASLPLCAVFVLSNLLLVTVTVAVLRRSAPQLWGAGGQQTFTSIAGLTGLMVAAAAGSAVGAGAGSAGLALVTDGGDAMLTLLWWGRNVTGTLAVTSLGHLLAHRLLVTRDGTSRHGSTSGHCRQRARSRALELLVLVVLSGVGYLGAFLQDGAPLAFPLLALSAWVGLRFSPLTAAAHSVGCGLVAIALTLRSAGPLPETGSVVLQAGLTQLFVAAVVLTAVSVAAIQQERADVLAVTRRAEALTAARGQLWRAAADSMTDGLLVVDMSGTVVTRNAAARALLGGVDQLTDRADGDPPGVELLAADGSPLPDAERPSRRAGREGFVPPHDVVLVSPGRGRRVLAVTATRLDDIAPYGDGPGAVVTFRDVTEEREGRDQLARFAGVVAHDLRNPLVTLNGWVEVAQSTAARRPDDTATLVEALRRAQQAAGRMGVLIDDLLAHARSKEGRLAVQRLDLDELVRDAAALHGLAAVRTAHLPPVAADRTLVSQLLRNLFGNSAKYVEPGTTPRVVVTGRRLDDRVVVEVSDNGIGIPQEARATVFDRFQRAHPDRPEYVGTGLGLALVKTVVERHGGTIVVLDGPGGTGSTFRFTLPAADLPPETALGATSSRPRHVEVA